MRKDFSRLALLLFLCCGLAGRSLAQAPQAPPPRPAPPAPPAPQHLAVMVVDVQALLQQSKAAKMVRNQIEQRRAEYTKEIARQEELLRQQRDKLQQQQASMSPAALNVKGRAFQQKVNELDRNVQAKRVALEKSNNAALGKIQQTMLKIIADIAKQRKANLVLQRSELVLFDRSFDVTDEVLQKLDQEMPTLTVEFVKPEAVAATPEPAPVAPKPRPKVRRK